MGKYNAEKLGEVCKNYVKEHGKDYKNEYAEFTIRKSNGQKRTIYAPPPKLRELQKAISFLLDDLYRPRPCVHGFIGGRSTVTNARQHVNKHSILKIDLKDFFESITKNRIKGLLSHLSLEQDLIEAITTICTVNDILPTGSPASPVLANMICYSMDNRLMELSNSCKIAYTRYSDDMTFSGYEKHFFNSFLTADDNGSYAVSKKLKDIIKSNGFFINEEKTGFFGKNKSHYVTGIKVNKKLKLPRSYHKNLEAILHMVERYGREDTAIRFYDKIATKRYNNRDNYSIDFRQYILGKISYVGMVEGTEMKSYKAYKKMFDKLFDGFGEIDECVYVIEWLDDSPLPKGLGDFCGQGTCFLLDNIGLVTASHVLPHIDTISLLRNRDILLIKHVIHGLIATLSTDDIIFRDTDIDIAIIRFSDRDSKKLSCNPGYDHSTGKSVKLVGFPDYRDGDPLTIDHSTIFSQSKYLGIRMIEIKGGIFGGMSGGPVLDMDDKVVGVIHKGNTGEPGFIRHYYIPISSMLERARALIRT